MADEATYGWEPVWAYHAVWLQQLENGHAEWKNIDLKLEFRRALVWNSAQCDNARPRPLAAPRQFAAKDMGAKPATSKPGTKSCALFNQRKCGDQRDNPADRHICSYHLNVAKKVCVHQQRFCQCKIYDEAAKHKGGCVMEGSTPLLTKTDMKRDTDNAMDNDLQISSLVSTTTAHAMAHTRRAFPLITKIQYQQLSTRCPSTPATKPALKLRLPAPTPF